ncbi:MAG: ribosome assembly cofactor RimP [Bacteroidales bacterium]|nr:ribosome assembly cofactor RimP [Bacteroidales bacterium]
MIEPITIQNLVDDYLNDGDRFLVEFTIKPGNKIFVYLDSDKAITITDCVKVSKHIESNLDRDKEDFELRVSSYGIDQPYKLIRQYKKNIGKLVKVDLNDGEQYTGRLVQVSNDEFVVKPEQPGKQTNKQKMDQPRTFAFSQVKETKGVVTFK